MANIAIVNGIIAFIFQRGLSVEDIGASVLSATATDIAAFLLRYNTALGPLLQILKNLPKNLPEQLTHKKKTFYKSTPSHQQGLRLCIWPQQNRF